MLCSALVGGASGVACGGPADSGSATAVTPSDEDAAPAPAAVVTPTPAPTTATGAAAAADAAPIAAVTGLTTAGDPSAAGVASAAGAAASDAVVPADSDVATAPPTTADAVPPPAGDGSEPPQDPAAQIKALLDEAGSKRTKDARATAALAEAEALGATPRDLAAAALKRGKALFGAADQAATWFQWAADKDPKFPDPVFELARQSVVTGEIEPTRVLLQQVAERGGKKLLKQIEFDPTWEIVKDDPEVKKLLR